MPRLCPCCNLPVAVPNRAYSATSRVGEHGVFLICRGCYGRLMRLPAGPQAKALDRAAEKALADPSRFLAKTYPSRGAAELMVAMLGHPAYASHLLDAVLSE